jgi:hypothetical protein
VGIDQARKQSREASDGATGTAQEVASQAKEQVQQKAEEVKGRASQRVREQLDSRSSQLGEQIAPFAAALRNGARQLEQDGSAGGARTAHRAADQVERLAGYLGDSSSDRLLADLERFGRRRPWAAGAVGAVLGFVGARFLKASSESRYDTSYRSRSDADMALTREAAAAIPPHPAAAQYTLPPEQRSP